MAKKILTLSILFSLIFTFSGLPNTALALVQGAADTAALGAFDTVSNAAGTAVDTAAAAAAVTGVPVADRANAVGWATYFHLVFPAKEGKKTTERGIDKFHVILKSVLKKRILDRMVDQIFNWIQGGCSPKFITEGGSFLQDDANDG